MFDVIIIGAGVTGCAIARELSRQERKILVLERNSDVCEGTSKANSGIVHSGYDAMPGTQKARFNLQGNLMMEKLSKELDFPYKNNGSLVLMFNNADRYKLDSLLDRGIQNGVQGLRIVEQDELRIMEPSINDNVIAALYAPTGGIVCPFNLTIALAENAAVNGVAFGFNTNVTAIRRNGSDYIVSTDRDSFETHYIINAAGVYADTIHSMVSKTPMHITPVRGQYCLFDKETGNTVSHTLFQLPTEKGKGVLITPTVHGNLMAGPTAEILDDKEAYNTTSEGIDNVLKTGASSIREVPVRKVITSFAGLRAHEDKGDFIVQEADDAKGFIDAAGIESPGLTAAPAIGVYVAELMQQIDRVPNKSDFISQRNGIHCIAEASDEIRAALIKKNPAYANVICRCETVTEGEIIEAIHRPLGATSLDGVKRRTRAGMGRCQSGFCSPKVVNILARELNIPVEAVTKCGDGSEILTGRNKEVLQ